MASLNQKQKSLLRKWYMEETKTKTVGLSFKAEHLPDKLFDTLVEIKDFETITQDIERFVHDLLYSVKRQAVFEGVVG